jgi:hypothetical protein
MGKGSGGGLAFLNKKSWHTGKLNNIERVWQKEEDERKEKQKMLELQKELAEERQIDELRKVQAENGLISKAQSQRLDWMYSGPAVVATAADREEYLLGKSVETTKTQQSEQR